MGFYCGQCARVHINLSLETTESTFCWQKRREDEKKRRIESSGFLSFDVFIHEITIKYGMDADAFMSMI